MKREKSKMTQKQNTLTKTGIVALLACVCCILWGSAISGILLFQTIAERGIYKKTWLNQVSF